MKQRSVGKKEKKKEGRMRYTYTLKNNNLKKKLRKKTKKNERR